MFIIDESLVEEFTVLGFFSFLLKIEGLRMKELLFLLGILIDRLAICE